MGPSRMTTKAPASGSSIAFSGGPAIAEFGASPSTGAGGTGEAGGTGALGGFGGATGLGALGGFGRVGGLGGLGGFTGFGLTFTGDITTLYSRYKHDLTLGERDHLGGRKSLDDV